MKYKTHVIIQARLGSTRLPEKVLKAFKFISENESFKKYTHIFKIDDGVKILKPVNTDFYKNIKYGGITYNYNNGARDWHIGKCSQGSEWNNKNYDGEICKFSKIYSTVPTGMSSINIVSIIGARMLYLVVVISGSLGFLSESVLTTCRIFGCNFNYLCDFLFMYKC